MAFAGDAVRQKLFGTLIRRERWGLSWRGYLALVAVLITTGAIWVLNIHAFFSITAPVKTPFLAVEGWVHDYAIRAAVKEFQSGSYERIFTTGGPVQGLGGYLNDYSTSASIGAGKLKAAGVPTTAVQMVPARANNRDRTYSAALALRTWCRENNIALSKINVLTADVHARRTRLLFQEAFGKEVEVGIIAVPNPDYDAKRWWRYSEAVRAVLGECIAYIYVKVFFYPPKPE
jgi:uncharacterized SAM-binding protein YcdF (DUF218 family)